MDREAEFLHVFFTHISCVCFEKAKEHLEKERELCRNAQLTTWNLLLTHLLQISLAEKSYIELGFLHNKIKSFLRKDNSLRAIYDSLRTELHRLQEFSKTESIERNLTLFLTELEQFLTARIELIDFYEKLHIEGSNKQMKHQEEVVYIEGIIERHSLLFSHISLTPVKNIFSLECEILAKLLKAFIELQNLQFLPSLALIYGAHTRLTAWETTLQNRESWKLGFLKNNPLPALFQWLMRLRGAVLSKYSLYFHDILGSQMPSNDMKQLCSKLHYDHYQKIASFQKRYDATCVMFVSDKSLRTESEDTLSLIVSYPPKANVYLENVIKIISDKNAELSIVDRIVFYYEVSNHNTSVLSLVEPTIYLAIMFDSKKTEKDSFIKNFMSELVVNLRCTKIFASLKGPVK